MAVQDPITDLMNDHRLIEAVLTALELKLNADGEFPKEFVEQSLNFFVEYADQFHHFKEEESLFPAIAERGVPVEGGPIGMMLHEHTLGRRMLAGIRENLEAAGNGDGRARHALRNFAKQYSDLLRNHIWKEDNVLFNMARRVLDEQASHQLSRTFATGGNSKVTPEAVDRYRSFAASLAGA
jgi:hemerythrin-like domain-containing protein